MDAQGWIAAGGAVLAAISGVLAVVGVGWTIRRDIGAEGAATRAAFSAALEASKADIVGRIAAVEPSLGERLAAVDAGPAKCVTTLESNLSHTIDDLRTVVTEVRDDMRTGFARVDTRLVALEQRTFEMARADVVASGADG